MRQKDEKSRIELLTIIRQQQQQIDGLQGRIAALEAEDVGQLRRQVQELEIWKNSAEERIRELEAKTSMTQGLTIFVGTSAIALILEKVIEALNTVPLEQLEEKFNELAVDKQKEIEEQFGDFANRLIQTIQRVDNISLQTWEKQRRILERRAATLPPLKRAVFEALNRFAAPSKVGTQLINTLLTSDEFGEKLTPEDKHKIELLVPLFDTFSNLWPLTVTNSLAPMLKHVGFDDAAEAAGEILDQLDVDGTVPRNQIHKVRNDLIAMGAIEPYTKPNTIIEYLTHGIRLEALGISPDEAASFGHIPCSSTQLKRAKRAYEGLQALYNRVSDYPSDVNLEQLETFGQSFKRAAEEKVMELRDLVAAELV